MRSLFILSIAAFCLMLSPVARAGCSGASVDKEFAEADVVVRASVIGETDSWGDEPDAAYLRQWGTGEPVVTYRLRVESVFKGKPGAIIGFYEERDSGAFYMDPLKDYLLFLKRYTLGDVRANAAKGAYYERYACGQSKLWMAVDLAAKAQLEALSTDRSRRPVTKPPQPVK